MNSKHKIEHDGARVHETIETDPRSFVFMNREDYAALVRHMGYPRPSDKRIYVRKHVGCVCIKPLKTDDGIYTGPGGTSNDARAATGSEHTH